MSSNTRSSSTRSSSARNNRAPRSNPAVEDSLSTRSYKVSDVSSQSTLAPNRPNPASKGTGLSNILGKTRSSALHRKQAVLSPSHEAAAPAKRKVELGPDGEYEYVLGFRSDGESDEGALPTPHTASKRPRRSGVSLATLPIGSDQEQAAPVRRSSRVVKRASTTKQAYVPISDDAPPTKSDSEDDVPLARSRRKVPKGKHAANPPTAVDAESDSDAPLLPRAKAKGKGKAVHDHPPLHDLEEPSSVGKQLQWWLGKRDSFFACLKENVKPELPKLPVTIADVYHMPQMPDRDIFLEKIEVNSKKNMARLRDRISGESKAFNLRCVPFPEGKDNAAHQHQVGVIIARILNQVPSPKPFALLPNLGINTDILGIEAARIAFPDDIINKRISINVRTHKSSKTAKVDAFHINDVPCLRVKSAGPAYSFIFMSVTSSLTKQKSEFIKTEHLDVKYLDLDEFGTGDEIAMYRHACNMLAQKADEMYGYIGAPSSLKMLDQLLQPHEIGAFGFVYGGKPLWGHLPCRWESNRISLSKIVHDALGVGKRDELRIKWHHETPWSARIMSLEKILQSYMAGEGILNALQKGYVFINDCEQSGSKSIEFDLGCTCTEDSRDTSAHVCYGCYGIFNCSLTVVDSQGRRLCLRCKNNAFDETERSDRLRRDIFSTIVGSTIHSARSEQRVMSLKARQSQPQPSELKARIFEMVQRGDTVFKDVYAGKERAVQAECLHSPFQMSVDAVFPFDITGGYTSLHTPGNIALTALYLNHMKSHFLPGVIGLVSESQALVDRDDEDADRKDLLLRFDHVFAAKHNVAKLLSGRLGRKMDADVYEQYKQVWVKCAASGPTLTVPMPSGVSGDNNYDWMPKDYARISKLIVQMESAFGRKLPRSRAGAPWMWNPTHMPADWNWNNIFRLFRARLNTLRNWCNKHWETVDDSERLLLECMLQWFEKKGRDDFFRLEMTIWANHPLRFSIGKAHHGQQMRTGWTQEKPRNYPNDYNRSLRNMLFESWLSNTAKLNFTEDQCQQMLLDVAELPWSTDFYTRLEPVPPLSIVVNTHAEADSDNDSEFDVEEESQSESE